MKTDNFYSDELMQVKLEEWSQHRVALVGDAAWAPTPFTGEGNQLAIIGGFVLAQEMSRNRSPVAFGMYEKRLRSYVETAQQIPLGGRAPYIFNPQTAWGGWVLRTMFWLASWVINHIPKTAIEKLFPEDKMHEGFDLEIEANEAAGLGEKAFRRRVGH